VSKRAHGKMVNAVGRTWLLGGTVCVVLVAVMLSTPAKAGSSMQATMPATGKPSKSGLRFSVDATWVSGPGYRPVRAQVTASAPRNFDRVLKLRLQPYPRSLTVVKELRLPAGATLATATMSVPQFTHWNALAIDVWEDGERSNELSVSPTGVSGSQSFEWSGPTLLVVAPVEPNIAGFVELFPNPQYGMQVAGIRSSGGTILPSTTPTTISLPGGSLPPNWINYSALDVIWIPLDELQKLAVQNPEAWRAITDWLRAGGNLCIGGAGSGWENLTAIEDRLKIMTTGARPTNSAVVPPGWSRPPAEAYGRLERSASPYGNQDVTAEVEVGSGPPPASSAPPFVLRDVGLGRVVALADGSGLPSGATWSWIFNSLEESRWRWSKRHGLSFEGENPDFYNFLVPGIGLPPVDAFKFMITVFVVAIGPVNYLLLRRWKRLHLLLFTVPACAATITIALVGYALVADGLATRVRGRSLTVLDGKAGTATSWSRLSYYAGLTPSGGLRFPDDAAVLPLTPSPVYGDDAQGRNRVLNLAGDQHLENGWLYGRTPTQFLVVRSHASQHRLAVAESKQGLRIHNQLGTEIQHLLIRGNAGPALYRAGIESDETVTLPRTAVALPHQLTKMTLAIRSSSPQAPLGMESVSSGLFGIRSRGRFWGNVAAAQTDSRLEDGMRHVNASAGDDPFEPRSFIAIVGQGPEIPPGAGSEEEAGFHVVTGTW